MKQTYDPAIFEHIMEGLETDQHVVATYYFEQEDVTDHLELVGFMTLEASTGGWIDFPGETPDVRKNLGAKVVGYYPVPQVREGVKGAIVQVAFPLKGPVGWEGDIPMLLTAVAGNITSMPGRVILEDIWFPKSLCNVFPGPRFGVDGIRELLGVPDRPLVNMMIKPKLGLPPKVIAEMCYEAAMGGVDHIKDDEMLAETYNCTFEDRVREVVRALRRAYEECGKKVIYTVNVTDRTGRVLDKARKAVEMGASGVMVNFPCGLETLRSLAEDASIGVPILFHPAGSESVTRISRVVWAKLARLCGADIYLPGSAWVKWATVAELERYVRAKHALQAKFYDLPKTFALLSSVAGKVPVFVADYGTDVILGGGAAIHGHPAGIRAGVRAIRQAIDAVTSGQPLDEYAEEHEELRLALERFGKFERPREKRY
ncbi:MAG: RuBisCO large subunit C-terminal-like domain-containing protein [Bacillota bacterium]